MSTPTDTVISSYSSPWRAALAATCLLVAAALLGAPRAAAAPLPGLPALPGALTASEAAPLLRAAGAPLSQADFASRALELRFRNRDGYEITVAGFGQTVLLGVSQSGGLSAATTAYLAHGEVGPDSMRARFAGLGRVAVRFRPSGRVRRRRGSGCPRRVAARFGVFVGDLSFDGEGGYTSVRRRRAKGAIFVPPVQEACGHSGPRRRSAGPAAHPPVVRPRGDEKPTMLLADWTQPLGRTAFGALALGLFRAHIDFFIGISEASEGSIAVVREAMALSRASSFAVDDTLSSAAVSPPPPFSGSGSFQHVADGVTSWTGSLTVSFPGAPGVPLTGPQFKAQLEREW